jgi:hypothetical protein
LPLRFTLQDLPAKLPLLLMTVVVYPILEEIVFRGLLQDGLTRVLPTKQLGGLSLANVLTSLLFVCVHLFMQPWQWALLVLFPSLVFGFSKERYQSLWAPIILHCSYNLGFVLLYK